MSATNPNIPERQVRDRQIAREIEELLALDANVNAQDINIQVQNGSVVLTGTVGSLREKEIAGSLAKKANGAVLVENDVVISIDEYTDDGKIRENVEKALGDFPSYDPTAVGVRLVEDGYVYLAGQVYSATEKKQAEEITGSVEGVRQIVNEISIAPGIPLDDITIHNMVMDALSDDPRIDPFEIDVDVKNGDVSLIGFVQDNKALDACTERASDVPGVKAVFNRLEVRETG